MMPIWLKCVISIIGMLILSGTKYKMVGATVKDVVLYILTIVLILSLIFLPWVIK